MNVLCERCSNIDLGRYFQSAVDSTTDAWGLTGPTSEALKLGSLTELVQRSTTCTFCRIVVNSICTKRLIWLTTPERIINRDRESGENTDIWIYSYCFLATSARERNPATSYRIGVAKQPPGRFNNPRVHHAGDIQLCADDAERLFGSTMGYGRAMTADRINISLPRQWMDICWNVHGSFCDLSDLPHTSTPSNLLCVDVARGCICLLPPGAKYCTLSYCWPSKRVLTLTKANYNEFLVPGSLNKRMTELPTVIADAIKFVNELGESFLWVDSLNIIQDDDSHKQHQIGQMDKVYGSSFLGIVAAKCMTNDALDDTGLARYNPGSRCRPQHIAHVGDMTLTVPFESIDSLIQESRYDRRQWTYQEWILPRRLIFFTDSQVYFRCSCNTFCEDSVGEAIPPSTTLTPVCNLWNPSSPHIDEPVEFGAPYLRSTPYTGKNAAHDAIGHYTTHIQVFTLRQLTYDEDTLDAFKGIQNILERNMQTRFWCGLPEKYLDRTMLWTPFGVTKRRMRRNVSFGHAFPSWSWAGWAGHIGFNYLWMTGLHCEVKWYITNDDDEALRLTTEGLPGRTSYAKDLAEEPRSKLAADEAMRADNLRIQEPDRIDTSDRAWQEAVQLVGWTTICKFHLTKESITWGGRERGHKHADNLKVTNKDGVWIGCVLVDRAWALMQELECRPYFNFVVLSRSEGFDLGETLDHQSPEMYDESAFPKKDWCNLNVMLVERQGDYFERVAVGVIHEHAWVAGLPTHQLVKLK